MTKSVRALCSVALVILSAFVLIACHPTKPKSVTKLDEAAFWSLVDKTTGADGEEAHVKRLREQLNQLPPEGIVNFHTHYMTVFGTAGRGDIWAAGLLLNGGHGSDDGFHYFRNWLIAQGSEIYRRALTDPDSLAAARVDVDGGRPSAEWELYGYVAADVYKAKTGQSIQEAAERSSQRSGPSQASSFDSHVYTNAVLTRRFPKLWAKYGEAKVNFDRQLEASLADLEARSRSQEVDVAGVGSVRAGTVLYHREHGPGTVLAIYVFKNVVMARIEFTDGQRSIFLNSEHDMLSREPLSREPK